MLKLDGITKVFKTDLLSQPFVALNDVSFEIPKGSMVGFLGANGAGKTTSIKIIMDFIRADKGTVTFAKEMGLTKTDIFKNVGFLPERPYFYQNLSGRDFLAFMGHLAELTPSALREAIAYWAPRFKIDHALNRELKTYSKGMLQRIGFLASILHGPELIILDEPLSGLDPIGRKEIKDVIVEVHQKGKTIFFSSHIVPDIEEICDRVVFLKDGKLAYDGGVDELLRTSEEASYTVKIKTTKPVQLSTELVGKKVFPEHLQVLTVRESLRSKLLAELLESQIDVVGIELIKPSLEEIFYKTKERYEES